MRQRIAPAAACLVLAACATPVFAATLFNNDDGVNSFISNAGNWDNGLPTGQTGTINSNATYDSDVTHSGYDILHTGGDISRGFGFASFRLGENSTYEMNGAGAAIAQARGINVGVGSSFILELGNANLTDNTRDTVVSGAGASVTVNGGTMSIGRDLTVSAGGTFTVNGGTVTGIDQLYTQSFSSSANGFFFNGGSTTADNFQLDKAGTATFGGSTAGSLNLLVGLGNGVTLDWLAGSQMQLNVAGADLAFYEGLYTGGDLLYEGSNAATFGDNFQVSGETLSLVPEPGSLALMGLSGLYILRRRRSN